jgi:hypothetical protein
MFRPHPQGGTAVFAALPYPQVAAPPGSWFFLQAKAPGKSRALCAQFSYQPK